MPYSEARKKYAREWYHKNKKRLRSDPKRKVAKKQSDKRYYDKNRDKMLYRQKVYSNENRSKVKEAKRVYYQNNRHIFLEKRKLKRQTEEYKNYMRSYRAKNKEKIDRQERITGARFIRRQIENLTDTYIVSQILMSPLNKLTAVEIRQSPELIDKKRSQIMLFRQKFGTKKMEDDISTILAEIELAQKKRDREPYQFIQSWRD